MIYKAPSIYKIGDNGLTPFIDATNDILEFEQSLNRNELKIYINESMKFGVLTGFVRKSTALGFDTSSQKIATIKNDKYIIKSLSCCTCSGNKSNNGFDNDFMCPVKYAIDSSKENLLLIPEAVNGSVSFASNVYGNGSRVVGYIFIE